MGDDRLAKLDTERALAVDRLQRLQRIATALSARLSADEVAEVILAEVAPQMGGTRRALWLVDPQRRVLRLVRADESHPEVKSFEELPLESALPGPVVVRTGEPIFVPSSAERDRLFPPLAAVGTDRSFAVLPLKAGGVTVGILALGFDGEHDFDHDERLFLSAVATQAGHVLERGRLVEAEQRSIEHARFLADASAALASSLEYAETLTKVARLAVPAVADIATVHLLHDHAIKAVTVAHRDPEVEASLVRSGRTLGEGAHSVIIDDALERGEAVLLTDTRDSAATQTARYAETAPLVEALGVTSVIAVPLIARGATLGVLTLMRVDDTPPFAVDDIPFFEEVGRRAAIAIDNSRGHARRKDLVATLEQAVDRSRQQLAFAADLAEALSLEQVAEVVVRRSREALGTLTAGVALIDETHRILRPVDTTEWSEEDTDWADAPVVDAVHDRRPVFHHSRAELIAAYPELDNKVDPRKRAFAQLPLVVSGQVIGALSLAWPTERNFDEGERGFMQLLANQCAQAVDRARLFAEKERAAETLSRAILPDRLPDVPGWELAARYQPAGAGVPVGGDWFDAWQLPDGLLGIAVGDVGGHGIRAAAVMGQMRNALRAYAHQGWEPGVVVGCLDVLLAESERDMYATALYVVLDPATGKITWSNAGHPPPLYVSADGSAEYLDASHGSLLGIGRGGHEQSDAVIEPGGMIIGFTDGLIEHRNESLEVGMDLLLATGARFAGDPETFLTDLIAAASGGWRQEDDLCVLVVRRAP